MGQFLDETPRGQFLDEPVRPTAEPTSSAVMRAYQAIARPITGAVSRNLADPLTAPLVNVARLFQGESPMSVATHAAPGTPTGQVNPLAEAAVPQTPLQAGAIVGTMALPWLAPAIPGVRALAAAHPALTRILGGALGGEAGGELEGRAPGVGAAVGGGGAVAGEGVGSFMTKLFQSAPGAKGLISDLDAANVANAIADISPTLKASMEGGIKTAADLKNWVLAAQGNKALSAEMQRATQAIDQQIGTTGLQIPSMQPEVAAFREQLGLAPNEPIPAKFQDIQQQFPGVSLNDAWKRMGELGRQGFSGAKESLASRTTAGLPSREAERALKSEIETALNQADPTGQALAQWEQARGTWREGTQLLKLLKDTQAGRFYPTYGEDVQLNTPMLQQRVSQGREVLERKLGPEKFAQLLEATHRGAPVSALDRLQPGPGGMLDALRMIFSGKGGSAAAIRAGTGVGELLPNVTSRYIGRQPLAIPAPLQSILDIALQRSGGQRLQ